VQGKKQEEQKREAARKAAMPAVKENDEDITAQFDASDDAEVFF
jgi:hypothetical protein